MMPGAIADFEAEAPNMNINPKDCVYTSASPDDDWEVHNLMSGGKITWHLRFHHTGYVVINTTTFMDELRILVGVPELTNLGVAISAACWMSDFMPGGKHPAHDGTRDFLAFLTNHGLELSRFTPQTLTVPGLWLCTPIKRALQAAPTLVQQMHIKAAIASFLLPMLDYAQVASDGKGGAQVVCCGRDRQSVAWPAPGQQQQPAEAHGPGQAGAEQQQQQQQQQPELYWQPTAACKEQIEELRLWLLYEAATDAIRQLSSQQRVDVLLARLHVVPTASTMCGSLLFPAQTAVMTGCGGCPLSAAASDQHESWAQRLSAAKEAITTRPLRTVQEMQAHALFAAGQLVQRMAADGEDSGISATPNSSHAPGTARLAGLPATVTNSRQNRQLLAVVEAGRNTGLHMQLHVLPLPSLNCYSNAALPIEPQLQHTPVLAVRHEQEPEVPLASLQAEWDAFWKERKDSSIAVWAELAIGTLADKDAPALLMYELFNGGSAYDRQLVDDVLPHYGLKRFLAPGAHNPSDTSRWGGAPRQSFDFFKEFVGLASEVDAFCDAQEQAVLGSYSSANNQLLQEVVITMQQVLQQQDDTAGGIGAGTFESVLAQALEVMDRSEADIKAAMPSSYTTKHKLYLQFLQQSWQQSSAVPALNRLFALRQLLPPNSGLPAPAMINAAIDAAAGEGMPAAAAASGGNEPLAAAAAAAAAMEVDEAADGNQQLPPTFAQLAAQLGELEPSLPLVGFSCQVPRPVEGKRKAGQRFGVDALCVALSSSGTAQERFKAAAAEEIKALREAEAPPAKYAADVANKRKKTADEKAAQEKLVEQAFAAAAAAGGRRVTRQGAQVAKRSEGDDVSRQ